jgi:Uma2 family endonuclease
MPTRCRVYSSDMRVRISKPTRYYHPNASVVCGEPQYAEDQRDVLVNPLIVFEVVSEGTAKFVGYRTIDSLQEYVQVWQDEHLIEHYRRLGEWQGSYTVMRGMEATLPLPSAGCELSLREIYYQVELP